MADAANNAVSPHHPNPLSPIPKDMQGSDSSLAFSPQWLLPKPGEKYGMDSHPSLYPGFPSHSDASNSSRNGVEVHDSEKKRDVFRPSLHDMEPGRRDRWRDEERDTNSAIRRDRWKDGEKEPVDNRKADRWVDTPTRHSGEARRAPSDRWNDLSSRDSNYDQRRESKWNTRWGPDEKESEKWLDSSRDGEGPRDKIASHLTSQGKEDREDDSFRPWRSSSSQNRGRGEPPHQTLTLNKQTPKYSYGRGRGESTPPTFSVGRGRVSSGGSSGNSNSSHSHPVGAVLDKNESFSGDPCPLKYSRIKLLDIYRMADIQSYSSPLEAFSEIPASLTQTDPLEPLALSAPTSEETVIIKGIDKGDIISSGISQSSKEGSSGIDVVHSGRTRIGSREYLPSAIDDDKDEKADESRSGYFKYADAPSEKLMHSYGSDMKSQPVQNLQNPCDNMSTVEAFRPDSAAHNRGDDVTVSREVSLQGGSSHPSTSWRNIPTELRSRTPDMGWTHQRDRDATLENSSASVSSYCKDEPNWAVREGIQSESARDSIFRRQLSDVLEKEQESKRYFPQPSPEELSLYYKDPQGEIQGPFSGVDLIQWYEAGYFGIDLLVRVANASPDIPFSSLGDVMPHLRAKARPPPGFGAPKQNEVAESLIRQRFNNHGKLHTSSSDIDNMRTEPRSRHDTVTESENRYLESLMSGNLSNYPFEKFASSEALQGYIGSNSGGMPSMGVESGKDLHYLLAQRMSLEKQRSIPNPHSYWPGRDAPSIAPKPEIVPESPTPTPHSKLFPSTIDSPRQVPLSHNIDLMSMLQGVPEKSSSSYVNNGAPGWSNFPGQGGMDTRQDKIDMHNSQQYPPQAVYGVQQQRQQLQNQPSLTNNVAQTVDPSIMTPEALLSSGLSQDPQMLALLQQQYLLSQLQLQSQPPVQTQLTLLDKLLLLKQQQKQEQQQQLLRQQQLLSQVLSENQTNQRLSEPYVHLQSAALPMVNGAIDHFGLRPPNEPFQNNSQVPISSFQAGVSAGSAILPAQASQDVGHSISPEAAFPHQSFERTSQKGKTVTVNVDDTQERDSFMVSAMTDYATLPDVTHKSLHEPSASMQEHDIFPERCVAHEQASNSVRTDENSVPAPVPAPVPGKNKAYIPEQINEVQIPSSVVHEEKVQEDENHSESPWAKEAKTGFVLRDAKKASEKKSRKQKNSKGQSSSEKGKGALDTSPLPQSKNSQIEERNFTALNRRPSMDAGETLSATHPVKTGDVKSMTFTMETSDIQLVQSLLPGSMSSDIVKALEVKDGPAEADSMSLLNAQAQAVHRAWKPAPGLKAKSLLEIQQEEQRVAQTSLVVSDAATAVSSLGSSMPWAGVVANAESKMSRDNHQDARTTQFIVGKPDNGVIQKSKKSQLHDLLAEEVLAKSNEIFLEVPENGANLSQAPVMTTQTDHIVDDDNFIQAKDTKKSRKKSAKGKGVGAKASTPVASADTSVASSPIEKGKSFRQVQQEKEVLPAPPSGPSLGDFVLWKGEPASPVPAPAWSADSGKLLKPTSLRDIQKEQLKKAPPVPQQTQVPTPQKAQSTRGSRGSGSSWPLSGSSPSKATAPIQINSLASAHSKPKAEEDLFWGPVDESKQEAKQSGFPSLTNLNSRGSKSTTVKGTVGGSSNRPKSVGKNANSVSSSPAGAQSSLKGRRDAMTKQSEAMDFRDWCESETVRLTGSKDTSFLEFCLKQSTSEAETLLVENLGSFDPDHEFIYKFLDYKELLSADVLEIAFQPTSDRKAASFGVGGASAENTCFGDLNQDMESSKGGGKKKGKKGKKVSPAVLGFNVVSNRIMMGEIQTIEE